ncbi:MAG: type I methionyl aminopeptidase [Patescibacteria group bacterium]|nr:type I methionyl aminopeptidase [Patescibacteria group bacterium]
MITIKSEQEIKIMAEAGKILSKVIKKTAKKAEQGITTKELDRFAEDLILKSGAKPAFKNYQGFPSCLCASINEVIVHGVPDNYKLKQGDILSLDLGVKYKGYFSDMAITIPVGELDPERLRLIRVTKKALKRGIKKLKQGRTFGDIGNTIQRYVESQGFGVVRELCGHGIGKELHEDPQILNYGKRHTGEKIKNGMVVCLEPMVVVGDWKIKQSKDGFGFETADKSLSAHFEHTILVTKNGPKILTI